VHTDKFANLTNLTLSVVIGNFKFYCSRSVGQISGGGR